MGKGHQDTKSLEQEVLHCLKDVETQSPRESTSSKTGGKRSCSRRVLVFVLAPSMLLLVILLLSLMVLQVKAPSPPPGFSHVCPDAWLGFRGKCYYFSSNESDWESSRASCESMGASLASVNNPDELVFIKRYKGPANHWFGLRKADDESWRWTDGTAFNNWFEVRGGGPCAYLNEERVSSSLCHTKKNWLCSRPDDYVLWRAKTYP